MRVEEKFSEIMRKSNLTVAIAESCTGGYLCDRITDISGSSRYFLGGIIAYSNSAKIDFLGVSRKTLQHEGAVSGEVAQQMAEGVGQSFGSDIAISTTGIAGPTGGTEKKPVGLVFIGIHVKGRSIHVRKVWDGNRRQNKVQTVQEAISRTISELESNIDI
mgnify:CR=1 FL=1